MRPSVVVAFVTGAALASGIVYVAVKPKVEEVPPPVTAAPAGTPSPQKIAQDLQAATGDHAKNAPPTQVAAKVEKPAAFPSEAAVEPALSGPQRVPKGVQEPRSPAPRAKPAEVRMVAQVIKPVSLIQTLPVTPDPPPQARAPEPAPLPPPVQPVAATAPIQNPEAQIPAPNRVILPAGANLDVRIGETLSTKRNRIGDNFLATLTGPLVVDGWVIAERGARVEGRVIESDAGGRVRGIAHLSVELVRVSTSDGQNVRVQTDPIDKKANASTGEDAAKVGGGAALGAIIGAIAGGGKGAGIGAGAGGAAGAGDVLITRGKPAEIPVETRLTFRVTSPVEITERK